MGCTIPGCGSSGHNRRTHDKHVPPGDPLIVGGDHASNEGGNQDVPSTSHGPDTGQSVVQAGTSGDQDPITADDIRAIPGVDHECEPAPGQVYFCRHCGEDLMVPLAAAPDPVAGSGLDEFAPEVVEAVSRIADEMVTPHGPGCTLADPCDECRRHVAAMAVDPERTIREQMGRTEDVFMCHHERCGHIDEEDCSQECDDADHEYAERHSDDVDPYPEQCEHIRCGHHEEAECGTDCADLVPPWRTVLGPDEPIRITLPGVYELDATEYHDPAVTGEWLSNSDARQLIDDGCPAQFRYDRDNGVRKTSEAFSVGHAVHAAILGKGEAIAVRPLVNPDNPDEVWDSWRKHSAQRWKAEQESAGRSVILPDQADFVEAMASAVHLKPRAHELLSQPGRPEVALFWVDPVTGVKRRCLVDYLPDGPGPDGVMRPVDIKSADEVAPNDSMEKKLYDHCWHRQAVTIADGIRALGLADDVHFHFIVQSKKAPHLVTVVDLDADAERIGGIENMRAMLVYKECVETGVWPDYAEDTVTLTVPPWISRLYEDEIEVSH